jgi:hypothetical protein
MALLLKNYISDLYLFCGSGSGVGVDVMVLVVIDCIVFQKRFRFQIAVHVIQFMPGCKMDFCTTCSR